MSTKVHCPNCGCDYQTAAELRAWKDETDPETPIRRLATELARKLDGRTDRECMAEVIEAALLQVQRETITACAEQVGLKPDVLEWNIQDTAKKRVHAQAETRQP